MNAMKCLVMVLAAVLATASTSGLAGDSIAKGATIASKAVQMSDEQLDQITAAGAVHGIVVSNPGNATPEFRVNDKGVMCINCDMAPSGDGTFVQMFVVNKGHPLNNHISKCLGRCPL